jgi:ABC-2 type transport system ATP-binding protein
MPTFYPEWDDEIATRLMRRFRIPRRTRSRKLSRGQRSALAIVLALASGAAYTFLDEPYLGLDATARGIFYDELLAVYAASHERAADGTTAPRTFIMSTHLIDEAAELIEEVLVLDRGRIVLQADVEDARRTAFLARGFEADVLALAAGRELLSTRRLGGIVTATIRGELSSDERQRAEAARVSIEPTTLQEFVAAIGQHGESDQPAPHLAPHPAPLPASQPASESRSLK